MASGGLTPLVGRDAYIGAAKQGVWGTAVPPTWWWRWLDGSGYNPEAKFDKEREGDTSPFISIVTKSGQMGMVKIVENARPIMAGYALEAVLGAGSDTYTAPAQSGTLSAAIAAGATVFSTALNLGVVGTLALNFSPAYASQTYEVATVDLTTKTGVGPFTYTLAAGGTFKNAHLSADPITSVSTHVLQRALYAYDPYTLEWAYGHAGGAPAQVWRLQDAVCTELKITSEKGKKLKFEHTWYGTLSKLQNAFSAPIYEGTGVIGQAGAPFLHYQAQNNWLLDGASSGNAVTIDKLSLSIKNSTDVEEFVTEALTPAYFIPGNIDIEGELEAIFQSFAQYNETFFGAQTLATGASDSYIVGQGSLQTTFQADAINALKLNLANVAYVAAKLDPKNDGKALRQPLSLVAQKTPAIANPFTATLFNSQASSY